MADCTTATTGEALEAVAAAVEQVSLEQDGGEEQGGGAAHQECENPLSEISTDEQKKGML